MNKIDFARPCECREIPLTRQIVMLRFFRSITTDEAQQQSTAALKCSAEQQRQASQLQQKAELLKRGPGRPKKLTDAHLVLAMAAVADTPKEEDAVVHRQLEQDERRPRLHQDGLAFLLHFAV